MATKAEKHEKCEKHEKHEECDRCKQQKKFAAKIIMGGAEFRICYDCHWQMQKN